MVYIVNNYTVLYSIYAYYRILPYIPIHNPYFTISIPAYITASIIALFTNIYHIILLHSRIVGFIWGYMVILAIYGYGYIW